MYALIEKCLHVQQSMIIWVAAVESTWLKRRVGDRKVAGSMPVMGINANYLTGTLCVV